MRRRALILVAASFVLTVAIQGTATADQGPLRVGAEVPQPGFWVGTTPGTVIGGFEYELANDIAARIGKHGVSVVGIPFATLLAGKAKGFDLALEEALITKVKAPIEFSTSYLDFDLGVMVRSGTNVPDLATARRLRWGVATAMPTPLTYMQKVLKPDASAQTFPELGQAASALQQNQVDAVLDYTVSVMKQAGLSRGRLVVVGQLRSGDRLGAILPRGSALLRSVNAAIKALRADDTIGRLAAQYLGGDPSTIPFLKT
jgi:polar amino acid transport system substrate-binding protein